MKSYLALVLFFAVTACSENQTSQGSEPAGIFDVQGLLDEPNVSPFANCIVDTLIQELPMDCKIETSTIQTQSDAVESGLYTFTSNGEIVPSVKLNRTVVAAVACLNDQKGFTSKGVATQKTSVIYIQKSVDGDLKSCDDTTAVWVRNRIELESGEVLEDTQAQLLE